MLPWPHLICYPFWDRRDRLSWLFCGRRTSSYLAWAAKAATRASMASPTVSLPSGVLPAGILNLRQCFFGVLIGLVWVVFSLQTAGFVGLRQSRNGAATSARPPRPETPASEADHETPIEELVAQNSGSLDVMIFLGFSWYSWYIWLNSVDRVVGSQDKAGRRCAQEA